jgi:hypothetical protein
MGTGGPFHMAKARLGRDSDHSPLSSAEVKNEKELYLLSPKVPPRHVVGLLCFPYTSIKILIHIACPYFQVSIVKGKSKYSLIVPAP